jgi:type I restriction enzyme S subunit
VKQIREIRLPLPPLVEQRRIAAILDQAEKVRSLRNTVATQVDRLVETVFLEIFGDPVTNERGFEIRLLGELCDVRDGTHDSPTYISNGGHPLITSKNLSRGVLDLSEVNYISRADYLKISKRSKVDKGDIIMPMIGTIGSPVLVDHEPNYAIKNVALIKFRTSSPSAFFIRHLLSCHYFDHVLRKLNRGGTQKFVSLGDLRSFPIPLPSVELQEQFATRIASFEKLRADQRVSLTLLDALFASLQHRAFSGQL